MIPVPQDQAALDVKQERKEIKNQLKSLIGKKRVRLKWLQGGTWDDLRREMAGGEPWHVFHFVGHGKFNETSNEGELLFVDTEGRSSPITARDLSVLLNHPSLRLVVLNTCEAARADSLDNFSSLASILAYRNIPAVIAMQYKITDKAALKFTRAFYETLVKNEPMLIDAAVTEARIAMKSLAYSMEWASLVLHMRSLEGILFLTRSPVDNSELAQQPRQDPTAKTTLPLPRTEVLVDGPDPSPQPIVPLTEEEGTSEPSTSDVQGTGAKRPPSLQPDTPPSSGPKRLLAGRFLRNIMTQWKTFPLWAKIAVFTVLLLLVGSLVWILPVTHFTQLGGLSLDSYCQSLHYEEATTDLSCSSSIDMTLACNWQYFRNDLTARTEDQGNPNSWRCYDSKGNKVGGEKGISDMNGYCGSRGLGMAGLVGKKTANDWKCQQRIDMTQACQRQYNRIDAQARENDGGVWECYGFF